MQRLAGPSSLSPAPGLCPFTVVSTLGLASELHPEESFVAGLAKNLRGMSHLYSLNEMGFGSRHLIFHIMDIIKPVVIIIIKTVTIRPLDSSNPRASHDHPSPLLSPVAAP